jgi:ankyrin repeat protein
MLFIFFKPRNLWAAAKQGRQEAIRSLVEKGAKINLGDADGTTPLMCAVTECGKKNVIELLLDLGAAIDQQDKLGATALDWSAAKGDAEVVTLLLARGANPNVQRNGKAAAPVSHSVMGGNTKVLDLLLKAKACVDTPVATRSPLQDAAADGKNEFVVKLLAAGANPNATDSKGFTPLFSAVRAKNVKAVELLLKAGADAQLVNHHGESVMDVATEVGNTQILAMLAPIANATKQNT